MDETILVRELTPGELPTTDPIYDELRFARTDPACTRMLGAFAGSQLVGLGRLIDLGSHRGVEHCELGGMWVAASHRSRGLAGRVIQGLVDWRPPGSRLWCTPFEHLESLYGAHGFERVTTAEAPPKLMERLQGCASAQDQSVIVMGWLPG